MKSRFVTSRFRKSPLFLTFSLLTAPLMAVDPATVLPDESVAYIELDSEAFYKLENHPVVKTFPLEKLKKLFYKLSGSSDNYEEETKKFLTEETGVSYEELVKKAGRVAISFHDLKVPANPTPENINLEFSVAEEFDADEAFLEKYVRAMVKLIAKEAERQNKEGGEDIQKILSKVAEAFEHSTVEHGGAKIHLYKLKDTDETKRVPAFVREWAFCIHEKMILVSSGQDQVEEMIDRMKSGGETGSLVASAYYKTDHERTGKAVTMASLNLETILGLVEKYALPLADTDDLEVKKLWTGLGADKLRSAVLAVSSGADTIDLAAFLTYSEKPGLLSVLAIPGPGSAPAFFPRNLASAAYQQIDVSKTFENAEKLATEIYPPAGPALNLGLQMVKQQTGVDVRKEFIDQLGPDFWTASSVPEESSSPKETEPGVPFISLTGLLAGNQVLGVRVKDSKAFALALKTVINKATPEEGIFEKQEYQGFTVNVVKHVPPGMKVSYVLTDDWLILNLNDTPALEQILSRLSKSGDENFFAQKSIARHMDALRGGQAVTSADDVGKTLKGIVNLFGQMAGLGGLGAGSKALPFDELAKFVDVPLVAVEKLWIDAKHTELRARIATKGE